VAGRLLFSGATASRRGRHIVSEKREHYRIKYRDDDRPTFVLGGAKYLVMDISEKGLRFDGGLHYKPEPGDAIIGKLVFKSGKSCAVDGKLLRYDSVKRACIVKLDKGISLALIMEEQRIILKKYNALD